LRAKPAKRKPAAATSAAAKPPRGVTPLGRAGAAVHITGLRKYVLHKPVGARRNEKLPLLVMLHGCGQDATGLSASSRMNHVADREGFFVLYPQQDRMANPQGCWNWFETRTGRAQAEADSIAAMIRQVVMRQAVDVRCIAVAGLSAGAGMAALLAQRHPEILKAVAMHSGIAPGVAHSPATALSAMLGSRVKASPHTLVRTGPALPALLVIQGSVDHIVAPANGTEAARLWATSASAVPGPERIVQRGTRYAMKLTDYRTPERLVASLCEVMGLGHAWSGGAAGKAFSDPQGPDASRMIWAFAVRQFALARAQ
jgi:poly(hydroxyalkanoate) depolymerase family esterase